METSDAKKLRALEAENAKLKKLLTEQMLDNAMLREVNSKKVVTPDAKRKAVAHLVEVHKVSQRRACSALNVGRSMVRYQSRRSDDTNLRDAVNAVAKERRRFGYRRLHVMVERQGWQVNHKKFRRIYREEKLQVRRRDDRKRALGTRGPMVVPDGPNQRWSLDFVSDALTDGRRFRILTVVDDLTRESLALVGRYITFRLADYARTGPADCRARGAGSNCV